MRQLIAVLALAGVVALSACEAPAGEPGAAPLSIGTLIVFPPILPVGVQGMVGATLGNVDDTQALSITWSVEPALGLVQSPSSCRALFVATTEVGTWEVQINVRNGEQQASGTASVYVTDAGSGAAQTDSDLDGLFDAWELLFFGSTDDVGPDDDPDHDGKSNAEEQEAGSDPSAA